MKFLASFFTNRESLSAEIFNWKCKILLLAYFFTNIGSRKFLKIFALHTSLRISVARNLLQEVQNHNGKVLTNLCLWIEKPKQNIFPSLSSSSTAKKLSGTLKKECKNIKRDRRHCCHENEICNWARQVKFRCFQTLMC